LGERQPEVVAEVGDGGDRGGVGGLVAVQQQPAFDCGQEPVGERPCVDADAPVPGGRGDQFGQGHLPVPERGLGGDGDRRVGLRGLQRHGAEQAALGEQRVPQQGHGGVQGAPQQLVGVGWCSHRLLGGAYELVVEALDGGGGELLFGLEVVEQRPLGDAGPGAYVVEGGCFVAAFQEQASGGVQEEFPGWSTRSRHGDYYTDQ
jgi:hypothetical protein